jgi:uncharacterized membrane protein YdjX (TVP38/TMEM64 family)
VNLKAHAAKIAAATALVAACVGVYVSPLRAWLTVDNVAHVLATIGSVWYAPALFIVGFAVACVLFLPASVFIVSAGLIWGGWPGSLYALVGALLGAYLSFRVSRYIGGDLLSKLGRTGERLARALDHAGFKALLILRLIPFFPFPVFNYGAGVSGVSIRDFMLSTTVGLIPAIAVITFSAEALFKGLLSREDALIRLVAVSLAVLALVGIPMLFKRKAARALHLDTDEPPAEIE